MTPEHEVSLGQRAAEVLENEAYIAAFESIRTEILDQWKNAPARDTEGREQLWLMQSMLNKVQATLESTMQGGKMAMMNLMHESKTSERAAYLRD